MTISLAFEANIFASSSSLTRKTEKSSSGHFSLFKVKSVRYAMIESNLIPRSHLKNHSFLIIRVLLLLCYSTYKCLLHFLRIKRQYIIQIREIAKKIMNQKKCERDREIDTHRHDKYEHFLFYPFSYFPLLYAYSWMDEEGRRETIVTISIMDWAFTPKKHENDKEQSKFAVLLSVISVDFYQKFFLLCQGFCKKIYWRSFNPPEPCLNNLRLIDQITLRPRLESSQHFLIFSQVVRSFLSKVLNCVAKFRSHFLIFDSLSAWNFWARFKSS